MIKYFRRHSSKQFVRVEPITIGYKRWSLNLPFQISLWQSLSHLFPLKQRVSYCIGTMKEHRIPKICELPRKRIISKSNKRGDMMYLIDKEDIIILVEWMDNNVVKVTSTYHGVKPLTQVPKSHLITEYNRFMRGTNFIDQQVVVDFYFATRCCYSQCLVYIQQVYTANKAYPSTI